MSFATLHSATETPILATFFLMKISLARFVDTQRTHGAPGKVKKVLAHLSSEVIDIRDRGIIVLVMMVFLDVFPLSIKFWWGASSGENPML